ncbi:nitroreductase family protein [Rhodobacteraceae bacterium NNCM2]|nr:nitroreductase family protein [Coraliihabitans acroporae]
MSLSDHFATRFGSAEGAVDIEELEEMAGRGSARWFTDQPVAPELIRTLAGVALASPTKSDLQQRDILIVTDPEIQRGLVEISGQDWLAGAPAVLVFLGNHRRQRRLSAMHGLPFGNKHADALFNAAVDAAVAMSAFVAAAERIGLGCCPISTIRNKPDEVSRLLGLPDLVFPAMGLGVGWPKYPPRISMRLPLSATVHENRFDDAGEEEAIAAYSRAREAHRPYAAQRLVDELGESEAYGWSEDKARQYLHPDRADWGAYLRRIGFSLE